MKAHELCPQESVKTIDHRGFACRRLGIWGGAGLSVIWIDETQASHVCENLILKFSTHHLIFLSLLNLFYNPTAVDSFFEAHSHLSRALWKVHVEQTGRPKDNIISCTSDIIMSLCSCTAPLGFFACFFHSFWVCVVTAMYLHTADLLSMRLRADQCGIYLRGEFYFFKSCCQEFLNKPEPN